MAGTSRKEQSANIAALEQAGTQLAEVIGAAIARNNTAAESVMRRSALRVVNRVKRSIQHSGRSTNPRSGRTASPRDHRPSAPGEPPATDTGRLVQSIDYTVGTDANGLYAEIGTNVEYAPHLEIGTIKMRPRPFIRPAIAAETDQLTRDIAAAVVAAQTEKVRRMPRKIEFG